MAGLVRSSFTAVILLLFSTESNFLYGWTGDIVLDVPRELHGPSVTLSPHAEDCHIYYYNKFPMTCGPNLAFNKATLRCDSLQSVATVDPECGEIFVLEGKILDEKFIEGILDEDYFDHEEEGGIIGELEYQDGSLTGRQKNGWHGKRLGFITGRHNVEGRSFVREIENDKSLEVLGGISEKRLLEGIINGKEGTQRGTGRFVRRQADQKDNFAGSSKIKPHRKRPILVTADQNGAQERFEGANVELENVNDEIFHRESTALEDLKRRGNIPGSRQIGWHGKRISFGAVKHNSGFAGKENVREVGNKETEKNSQERGNYLKRVSSDVRYNKRILRPRQDNKKIINRPVLAELDSIEDNLIRNQKIGWHGKRISFGAKKSNNGNTGGNDGKKLGLSAIKHNRGFAPDENDERQEDGELIEAQENEGINFIDSQQIGEDNTRITFGAGKHSRELSATQGGKKNRNRELAGQIRDGDDILTARKTFGWHGKRVGFGAIDYRKGVDAGEARQKFRSQQLEPHGNEVRYKSNNKQEMKGIIALDGEANESVDTQGKSGYVIRINSSGTVASKEQNEGKISQNENHQYRETIQIINGDADQRNVISQHKGGKISIGGHSQKENSVNEDLYASQWKEGPLKKVTLSGGKTGGEKHMRKTENIGDRVAEKSFDEENPFRITGKQTNSKSSHMDNSNRQFNDTIPFQNKRSNMRPKDESKKYISVGEKNADDERFSTITEQKANSQRKQLKNISEQVNRRIELNPRRQSMQQEDFKRFSDHQTTDRIQQINGDFIDWNGVKLKQIRKVRIDQNKDQSENHEQVFNGNPTGGWSLFHHLWKNNAYK